MRHDLQVELLDEILGLRAVKSAYLDEAVTYSPIERYISAQRFEAERDQVLRKSPQLVVHASELAGEGDFVTRRISGVPVLLTRDRQGQVHAHYNVCRHRGAKLVEQDSGCKHRFSCPYHAWTWDNEGNFINAPHKAQGFPDLETSDYGLKKIAVTEAFGWIWCQFDTSAAPIDIAAEFQDLSHEFEALAMQDMVVHACEQHLWKANWKVLVEGGLEAYHFRVAHAKTIGTLFHDNLSTYRLFGPHFRSILARKTIDELIEVPRADWRLREHANVLYNIFPSSAWLVQADHLVWIQFDARSADETNVTIKTLRPRQDSALDEKHRKYWDKNQALTVMTLNEDFALAEQIQANFETGVNSRVTFGKFEGALDRFNKIVDDKLAS